MTAALLHAELADRRAVRVGQRDSSRGPPSGWCWSSSGVDAKSLVVPEAGHLALRPAYESNLRATPTAGAPALQAWLLYCAEAYAAGAEASPCGVSSADRGSRCALAEVRRSTPA